MKLNIVMAVLLAGASFATVAADVEKRPVQLSDAQMAKIVAAGQPAISKAGKCVALGVITANFC
jgi:hypothetical protein